MLKREREKSFEKKEREKSGKKKEERKCLVNIW